MDPLGTGDPLRLGPYRLLGVLGEGGMGKVYFAQDGAGRPAAVKVLRPELAHDRHLAQRFVREAQMAQAVTSKGVARVLGAQTEGGRLWIACEFLAGPTLDEAIQAYGPMDEPTLRVLASALARTLQDIHTAGLIHRDLKPANIVLTSAGPRVIDFGIARPEHGLTLTTTGQIPVTPGYGAPEQVLGQRVGPPSDVFSLGAVLVYAAGGRRAFDGAHVAAVQYEVVHGTPDLSHVPPHLHPLIGPCLAKDAAARPTPALIAEAFVPPKGAERAWRQGPLASDIKTRESTVRQITVVPKSGGVSRRRLIGALAAGGGVLAAGGGGTAWWLTRGDGTGPGGTPKQGPFDIPPAVTTPEARILDPNKGEVALGIDAPELIPLWQVDGVDDDSPPPKPIRDVIVLGRRGGGLAALSVVDGKERWKATGVDATGRYLSLDDQLVAAVGKDGALLTFVASTGEPKWTAPDAEARSVLAADDEAVYVVTKAGKLRSISRKDAKIRWTVSSPVRLDTDIRPRGAAALGRLVLCAESGTILAVDTRDGRKAWTFESGAKVLFAPVINGDRVFFGGKNLTSRQLADGKEIWTTKPSKDAWDRPEAWSVPNVVDGAVYAMCGVFVQRVRRTDGALLWQSGSAIGDPKSPVLLQGTHAWILDVLPEVIMVSLEGGRSMLTYRPKGDVTGFNADGNRVFVMTKDGGLTALPVV
ncbi:PQQ-binding-like beta-propeller repeat protein [Streptomyces purpureus]|uniref:protein kinase domain-containing protein n=1 Tax=Streptomyces purpureus TaxID=1951 RepID=UPI00379EA804